MPCSLVGGDVSKATKKSFGDLLCGKCPGGKKGRKSDRKFKGLITSQSHFEQHTVDSRSSHNDSVRSLGLVIRVMKKRLRVE